MAEMNEIVKLAVDAYHGKTNKYSVDQSMDTLHQAVVALNGGKTQLNYKDVRDGKCNGLFTLVETVLSRTVVEGLPEDAYFQQLVEMRNVATGDRNVFVTEDTDLYIVSDAADGTQGILRQRIGGRSEQSIPTRYKVVKIYEELNRTLSNQVDFNTFIQRVSDSFKRKLLDDIWALWSKATADDFGGSVYFPVAGSYNEDTLLDTIDHVEAAAGGKPATILGTMKSLRSLKPAVNGTDSNSDIYNNGYWGKFYGRNVVVTPQRHKVHSTEFVFPNDEITIIGGDDKPIKLVYEGQPILNMGDPLSNGDITQEYLYGEKYGLGIVLNHGNAGIGRYKMS